MAQALGSTGEADHQRTRLLAEAERLRQVATTGQEALSRLTKLVADSGASRGLDRAALDRQRSEVAAQVTAQVSAEVGAQLSKLQEQTAADRSDLALLKAQVAQARAPADGFARERAQLLAEVEKLRQDAAAGQQGLARLSKQVADAAQPRGQDVSALSEIAKLRQETAAGRSDLALLKTEVTQSRALQAPPPAADVDRRRTELLAEIEKVRQEAASGRKGLEELAKQLAGVAQLSGEVAKLRQDAASDRSDTARIKDQVARTSQPVVPAVTAPTLEAFDRQKAEIADRIAKIDQDTAAGRIALADLRTKLDDSLKSALPASAALDRRVEDLKGGLDRLQQESAANRASIERLESQLAKLSQASTPKPPQGAADMATASIVPPSDPTTDFDDTTSGSPSRAILSVPSKVSLPQSPSQRVVVRFARDSQSARKRAATLERDLQARGLYVVKSAAAPARLQADRIVYYYTEDRASAESIAADVDIAKPVKGQFSVDDSLPRPGTIEVTIVK